METALSRLGVKNDGEDLTMTEKETGDCLNTVEKMITDKLHLMRISTGDGGGTGD